MTSQTTREQEAIALLTALAEAPAGSEGRKDLEKRLLEWIDQHLRDNLKAIMAKTFGPQVLGDTSLRYSSLWGDVSIHVLIHGLRADLREPSLKTLTSYFSVALANQARDYLKRRKKHEMILDQELRPLVESREKHLLEKHRLGLDVVLDQIDRWHAAGDRRADVLRYFYIVGLTHEQIALQMSLTKDKVKHMKQDALSRLKELMGQAANEPRLHDG